MTSTTRSVFESPGRSALEFSHHLPGAKPDMNRSATWVILLCAVLTLSFATPANADYGAGRAAWKAGRYAEALKEWRASARKGDPRAMLALGRAFVKGLGVPQDFIEAHKWFNLAAARGDAKAAAERDALAKQMTAEERAEARKLARAWRPAARPRTSSLLPRRKTPRPAAPPRRTVRKGPAGRAARASAALRAASAGNVSALERALAAGADPNARGKRGWTPLMYAANKGYTLLVPPLLEAGAKPNFRAADGATALFIAALHGRSEIIASLMKAGADPSIKGPKGKTAEEVAYLGKNPRIMEALGLIKTIRESDGIVWKGAVLGGKRHGRWTKTKADGAIVDEGPYIKGKKHGQWKETHRDGIELGIEFGKRGPSVDMRGDERLETGPYVEGQRHGGWTLSAYYSGKLKFRLEGPYVKGKKHGRWKVLAPTPYSRQLWEGSYVGGKKDGLWKYSFANQSATYYYRKGKKHGPLRFEKRFRSLYEGREVTNHTETLRTAYVDDLLHGMYVYESKYRYMGDFKGSRSYEYQKGKYVKGERHGKWLVKYMSTKRNRNEAYYEFYDNGRSIRKSPLNQAPASGGNEEVEEQNED